MKIGLVEDNPQEQEKLESYIKEYCSKENIPYSLTVYSSAEEYFPHINEKLDLMFLDIELPGQNGMDIPRKIRTINKDMIIVFVTNMAQYAVTGYEVEALDFIVKPLKQGLFNIKFNRIIDKIAKEEDEKIVISINRQPTVFFYNKIVYIETSNHNINIYTEDGNVYKARAALSSLEEDFLKRDFYRVSSYALVNLRYVEGMDHDDIICKGMPVRVSRPKKKGFMDALGNYLGRN